MYRVKQRLCPVAVLVCLGLLVLASCAAPTPATDAVVFKGARLIVGDGSAPIENATFVVDDGQFVQVGSTNEVAVPDGATHVDLSGMTVMPAIIDTIAHRSFRRQQQRQEEASTPPQGRILSSALALGAGRA